MPRQARVIIPNFIYHVLNRGNNKENVFLEDEDFKFYLGLVKKYKEKFGVKIYHYSLMPNHKHLLCESLVSHCLAKFMHGTTLVYTQYAQEKYGKVGHIWQGRYKSPLVEKEDYMLQCAFYIEDNPRRAGLVKDLKDWPWSSYHFYAFGKEDPIVDIDPYYLELGTTPQERQENYCSSFVTDIAKEEWLGEVRQKLAQGILGSQKFVDEMADKFKIKLVRVGQRGRPRKE